MVVEAVSKASHSMPSTGKIMPSVQTAAGAVAASAKEDRQSQQAIDNGIHSILQTQPVGMKSVRHGRGQRSFRRDGSHHSVRSKSVFAELRDHASIAVTGNPHGDAATAAAGSESLALLNERAYNVFLQFTDKKFDHQAYSFFKRSDNNYWTNLAVFVVLLSFAATCATT